MRLGIYHSALRVDGDRVFTIPPFARYLTHLARKFSRLVLIAPVYECGRYDLNSSILVDNISIVRLPPFASAIEAVGKSRSIKRALRGAVSEIDVLWMRYPNSFGECLFYDSLAAKKHVLLQIVGDPLDSVIATDKYRGITRLLALNYARLKEWRCKRMCRYADVAANGSALFNKFSLNGKRGNVRRIITSTLIEDDYCHRVDTCQERVVRLLYVGYLQRRKGLKVLIDAFSRLYNHNRSLRLDIVGDGEDRALLQRLIDQLNLSEAVSLLGWVPLGDELNEIHRKSDMFIFPTLAGEGTPRAILQAMANSLPVISTSIAGIPDVINSGENGILVRPACAGDIVDAVKMIINSPVLRRRLVCNAYITARKCSMSAFLDELFVNAFEPRLD